MMARKTKKTTAVSTVRNIRRNSRKRYSGEEKIRIVLEGLRGEESTDELCRPEVITESIYALETRKIPPLRLTHGTKSGTLSLRLGFVPICPISSDEVHVRKQIWLWLDTA